MFFRVGVQPTLDELALFDVPEDATPIDLDNTDVKFTKGDRVEVTKGDLIHMTGIITEVNKDRIMMMPNEEHKLEVSQCTSTGWESDCVLREGGGALFRLPVRTRTDRRVAGILLILRWRWLRAEGGAAISLKPAAESLQD